MSDLSCAAGGTIKCLGPFHQPFFLQFFCWSSMLNT